MKKRYTKKQIVEAIKHWKSILKRMDESKSPLLDACSKEFGFETMTNIPIEDTGNDYSFDKFNEIASKDIALLKETDDLLTCVPYVFPEKIKDKYKYSNVVHFDNDGYFSFSFGIPMTK